MRVNPRANYICKKNRKFEICTPEKFRRININKILNIFFVGTKRYEPSKLSSYSRLIKMIIKT